MYPVPAAYQRFFDFGEYNLRKADGNQYGKQHQDQGRTRP